MSGDSSAQLLLRTARGAAWVITWRLGLRLLGLVSTLILVRLLTPADFGCTRWPRASCSLSTG